MSKIYPVIMSGGAGTRLWPLSKKSKPKQYHAMVTKKTMFTETLLRLRHYKRKNIAPPIIICAQGHEDNVMEQSQEAGIELTAIILEPSAQNTAAVGAIAAQYVSKIDPDAMILLLPADHHIEDTEGFWGAIDEAYAIAKDGYLATFGIHPTRPETGFGYIERGQNISGNIHKISAFKEKPDADTAQSYISAGGYSWNAGIFLFHTQRLIKDYALYGADIYKQSQIALDTAETKNGCIYLDPQSFAKVRSEPIDITIMENTHWAAVLEFLGENTEHGCVSSGDVKIINSTNTMVKTDGKFVAAIGVQDLVIISTDDAVLVLDKSQSQNVKLITNFLKENGRENLT